jgi:uncharacterized protein YgbK (DUF1537 family)
MKTAERHITIVLDDDPTGTQTVYDIVVLTDHSYDMLEQQFKTGEQAFFILTNTRAFPPGIAKSIVAEICKNIKRASTATNKTVTIILRGDSTLRSHFPLEADTVESVLGKADKWILCPFFLEGNRITKKGVHYLVENGMDIPVAETHFARDASFGYNFSDLTEWIIEKSKSRFSHDDVSRIDGEIIDELGEPYILKHLVSKEKIVIISVEKIEQVRMVTNACKKLEGRNKTFIYCTAASFVQVYLLKEKKDPLPAGALVTTSAGKTNGGLIIVGSYVAKTTQQLQQLLQLPGMVQIEISVSDILAEKFSVPPIVQTINSAVADGRSVVIFTSREIITANSITDNLSLGKRVSDTLIAIIQQVSIEPAYCIAKGGITSSDIATKGLAIKKATILGQALPGVPVWQTGNESKFPGMRYVIFPGNVGDPDTLKNIVIKLEEVKNASRVNSLK